MNVVFKKRNFQNLLTPLNLCYRVKRYSHSVIGGPKLAEINATGAELDLWELVEYARQPTFIISDKGDAVWWGDVAEARINVGHWSIGISIDSMANAIDVAYEDDANGGQPTKTGWAVADDSIAEYGRRELLLTSSGSNLIHALAARDKYLAAKKYPIPVITKREKGPNGATLFCRGWFDTLKWMYAPIDTNVAYSYLNIGTLEYPFGDTNAEEIAQGLQFSGDCNLASISIYIKKVGAPSDNLTVSLNENTDNITPGAELTSGSIAGTALTTSYAWVNVTVTPYAFTGLNSYFIKLSRSGAQDVANYYEVMLDNVIMYPLGTFNVLIGASWGVGPDADMPFILWSNDIIETSQQISTLVSNFGQFIGGISIDNQSGLYTASARDGNANALFEITELMKMGTVNYRRLLARIDEYRKMILYEEPVISTRPNLMLKDGSFQDPYGTLLRKETCPVGFWIRMKDIIPSSVDISKMADPTIQFIDEMEYFPDEDRLEPTARDFIDPFEIGVPEDG